MRPDKLWDHVKRQPFEPFRLYLTNGKHFDIRHPELIYVTQRTITVAKPIRGEEIPESVALIDPIHITHVEPLNGSKNGPQRKRRKKS